MPHSEFYGREVYAAGPAGYQLLPFRFLPFDEQETLLVNEAGEYLFLLHEGFHQFVSHTLSPTSPPYADLKAKHFLADSTSSALLDVLATKVRTKKSFLYGFTKLHIFVVTLRCDHSCLYCQVSRQSVDKLKFDMSQETASKAVDLMFQSPAPAITLEFQGGEPLLNFDLIKFIVEAAEHRNETAKKHLEITIVSNLSQITDTILDYCRVHGITLSTSLDGPAFIHNANRPNRGHNSYEITIESIKRARVALGINKVAALMTTTKLSLQYPREIIDEYVQQGFKSIFLRPISPYGFAVRTRHTIGYEMDDFLRFYQTALDYIIDLNQQGIDFIEVYAKILLTKILTPFPTRYVDLQSPASGGIGVVVYNYEGDVYATDEARMLAEMGDHRFRLGNVHQHSYQEIFTSEPIRSMLAASCVETLPGCSECAFQVYCGADPVYHYATQGDLFGHRPTSGFCRKNMALFKKLFASLRSADPEVLRIWFAWIRDASVHELPLLTKE